MECLADVLKQCSKDALQEVVKNMCVLLQVVEQGKLEKVKTTIYTSLAKQKREEQRKQENDRNAFAVVLGACPSLDAADKRTLQVTEAGDVDRVRA